MRQIENYLQHILDHGTVRTDRTGTGTIGVFGYQMRFDLSEGFPMTTTRKGFFRSIVLETLWFLRGESNISYLQENGVKIWDAWANEKGELGEGMYPQMWRAWPNPDGTTLDQISNVIHQIRTNPNSRRHLVVAFNPSFAETAALPPCHSFFQFYVSEGKLSCQLYQRSSDALTAGAWNAGNYSLLTHMIAQQCNLDVGEFIFTIGDAHIYLNHLDAVKEQLSREPYPYPTLVIKRKPNSIFDYTPDDFSLDNYQHHPPIKIVVAV